MSYLVLARKYRPQTFQDVVKQDHVTQTLINAIKTDRVAHAILFSGPRGTGKTTIARILAKSMNCAQGPTAEPCNACQSCLEITRSNATDVYEIDGASNNSVDQIRELRDNVKYMPAHSPYKIYIIDEVHMLSMAAFNALLKTLEEPPTHVMFLFATTEPHKIPLTILSRCQQHDLRRITTEAIANHLSGLCQKEGLTIPTDSLHAIAREADGCMRDALSLLDQVISFAEGDLAHDQILDIIGAVDRKIIADAAEAIIANDIGSILEILNDAYYRGFDLKKFYAELILHFRNLVVVKLAKNAKRLVDLPTHEIDLMYSRVEKISAAHLIQMTDLLFKQEMGLRMADDPKIVLEMTFIRAFQAKPVLPIDELIEKLDDLRKGWTPEESPSPMPPPPPPQPTRNEPPSVPQGTPRATNFRPPPVPPSKADNAPGQVTPAESPENTVKNNPQDTGSETPAKIWQTIIRPFNEKYPSLAACLEDSRIQTITADEVTLEIKGTHFNLGFIKRDKNMTILKEAFAAYFGAPKQIRVIEHLKNNHQTHQQKNQNNQLRQEAMSHPLVAEAINIFSARVVDVKILEEE